jgi:hypothetical protein
MLAADEGVLDYSCNCPVGSGVVALALLFVAEFTLVLWFRGMTIDEYIASRDPVAERCTSLCSGHLQSCRFYWPEDEIAGSL